MHISCLEALESKQKANAQVQIADHMLTHHSLSDKAKKHWQNLRNMSEEDEMKYHKISKSTCVSDFN